MCTGCNSSCYQLCVCVCMCVCMYACAYMYYWMNATFYLLHAIDLGKDYVSQLEARLNRLETEKLELIKVSYFDR